MGPQSSAEAGAQQGDRLRHVVVGVVVVFMGGATHLSRLFPPPSDPVQPGEDHPEGGAGEVGGSSAQEDSLAAGPQPARW